MLEEGFIPNFIESTGEDRGLALYRDEATRSMVESFYGKITGSPAIAGYILENADRYDIPVNLAFSLCWAESKFNPRAVNTNKSSVDRGLFQLNSRSFPHMTEKEFFDPKVNAQQGLKYLRTCLDIGGNEIVALAMYNAGRDRVSKQGAPLMTLDHISTIVEYRKMLDQNFDTAFSVTLLASAEPSSERKGGIFRRWSSATGSF